MHISLREEDITASELEDCLRFGLLGKSLLYASAALYLYDYCLTIYDETRYMWKPRRVSLTSVTYILARYPALASCIMILIPAFNSQQGSLTLLLAQLVTCARLISIVASEFILAVRTWALWEKRRSIFCLLAVFSVSAIIPAAIIVAKDITSSHTDPIMDTYPDCIIISSDVEDAYVVPYVLTIVYEGVTLTLSLIRITRWRRRIPGRLRAPILDTLWRDGVLYFTWTLLLGFFNIALVTQSSSSPFRSGGSQLQAVIHSILSCRVVLHLAGSKIPKEINSTGCSLYTNPAIQFTTQFEVMGVDASPVREGVSRDSDDGRP